MTISYRRKKNFAGRDFGSDLGKEIALSLYEKFDDLHDLLEFWHSHFLKVLDKHAPIIKRRVRDNKLPGWFNSEIRASSRKRDFFIKQFQKNKNPDTWCLLQKMEK